jgi:TolC family type I secretion outer membrane protein
MTGRIVACLRRASLLALTGCPMLFAQPRQAAVDSLTLEEAVKLALEHHPSMQVAAAGVEIADAGLTQARAGYYPTLSGTASLFRTDGAFVLNPTFPPRNQSYNTYSTGLQIQQTIFDFGRTIGRVSAGGGFVDAANSDREGTRQSVVMNVELAYFELMQATEVVGVDEEAVAQANEHLRQAKAFYSVGRRPQSDVTKAEVDVANAEVNLIRARNQMRLAKVSLENSMGVHPPGDYRIREAFEVPSFTMTLDSAEASASLARPELVASQARVAANRSLATAAWDQHLPTISASGNWTWSNFDFPLFSRWTAGVTLTVPIFQGFAISGQVDQARANADAAQADLELLKESVREEIEQNYLSLREAEERIAAATKLVDLAEENFRLADRQYAAGVGTAIDAADAQLSLSNARITKIQALSDYNGFLIRLQRSIGIVGR